MINYEQFLKIKNYSLTTFSELRKKYPELSGHLEYYSRFGQAELKSDIFEIIKMFPDILEDNFNNKETIFSCFNKVVKIEKQIDLLKKENKYIEASVLKPELLQATSEFENLMPDLVFKDTILVVIIFDRLDFELIWKLQHDQFISNIPEHTPQTKASIRVALGSLETIKEK